MQDLDMFLEELRLYGMNEKIPNISLVNAKFLQDIIRIGKVKKILEIGTANGYSTMQMARVLPKDGEITTIEFSEKAYNSAGENFEKSGLGGKIKSILGNAIEVIPSLDEKFDMVFIDGMKKRSKDFLLLAWEKIDEGVIVIDDVIKFKHKMEDFYEFLEEKKVAYNVLPIDKDDGVMMIVKEKNQPLI